MAEVAIKYNNFSDKLDIKIDNEVPKASSNLNRKIKNFKEWADKLAEILLIEYNTRNFNVTFYGSENDYKIIKSSLDEANKKGFNFNLPIWIPTNFNNNKLEKIQAILKEINEVCKTDEFLSKYFKNSQLSSRLDHVNNIIDENDVLDDLKKRIYEVDTILAQEIGDKRDKQNVVLQKYEHLRKELQYKNIDRDKIQKLFLALTKKINEEAKAEVDNLIKDVENKLLQTTDELISKKCRTFNPVLWDLALNKENKKLFKVMTVRQVKLMINKISDLEKEFETNAAFEINKIIKKYLMSYSDMQETDFKIILEKINTFNKSFQFTNKEWLTEKNNLDTYKLKLYKKKISMFQTVYEIVPVNDNSLGYIEYDEIEENILTKFISEKIKLYSLKNKSVADEYFSSLISFIKNIFDESSTIIIKNIKELSDLIKDNLTEQKKLKISISNSQKRLDWIKEIERDIDYILTL